jgi:hypothetical protein
MILVITPLIVLFGFALFPIPKIDKNIIGARLPFFDIVVLTRMVHKGVVPIELPKGSM